MINSAQMHHHVLVLTAEGQGYLSQQGFGRVKNNILMSLKPKRNFLLFHLEPNIEWLDQRSTVSDLGKHS